MIELNQEIDNVLLQALMEKSPDFIFVKDRQSRFVKTNPPHAQLLLGLASPQEAVGKTDFELFPEKKADAQRFFDEEQVIMETGQPVVHRQWRVPNAVTGDMIWVSESKFPIQGQDSEIIGLLGISSDITRRKQAELERDRLLGQLQAVINVTSTINTIHDPQLLARNVVEIVRQQFDLYYVGLFTVSQTVTLYEQPGEYAYLRAATGEAGMKLIEQGQRLKVGGDSMIGQCIATGTPRLALDAKNARMRFSNPLLPDTATEAVLPLKSRDETIGALTIQSAHEDAFTQQDISVFQIVAQQLAVALENAYLYQRIDNELENVKASLKQYVRSGWDNYLKK